MQRIFLLAAMLCSLSACVIVPRVEMPESISFNYEVPSQMPMSYNDLLCCYDCHA